MNEEKKKYRITDGQGKELGEGEGPSEVHELLNLFGMAGVQVTRLAAQEMIDNGGVCFEELA